MRAPECRSELLQLERASSVRTAFALAMRAVNLYLAVMRFVRDHRRAAPPATVFAVFGFVMIVSAACSHDDEVMPCERMRDHLIDLKLADATGVDRDAHREVLRRALGESLVTNCKKSMRAAQVLCILNAADSAAANACVASSKGS